MRVSKLMTVSAIAILMGGTSLAMGQGGSIQGGDMQRGPTLNKGSSVRGSEAKGPYARSSEGSLRRSEIYGERGSKVQGLRKLEREQAMTGEHGRGISGARNRMITGERGQAAEQTQGQFRSGTTGLPRSYGSYGSTRNAEIGLNAQQRTHLSGMLSARRDIPRVSSIDTSIRVGAVVPRNVRMVRVPREVARMHPRLRGDQVFLYRDQIVLVDPATLRIIAVLPA